MQSLGKFRPTLRFNEVGHVPDAWMAKEDALITNKFMPRFPVRSKD